MAKLITMRVNDQHTISDTENTIAININKTPTIENIIARPKSDFKRRNSGFSALIGLSLFLPLYTVRQKKATNFLLCASFLILDKTGEFFNIHQGKYKLRFHLFNFRMR